MMDVKSVSPLLIGLSISRSVMRPPSSSVRFSSVPSHSKPPTYVGDSDDSDNEMVGGEGRVATPTKDPRRKELPPASIKEMTHYRLKDPTLRNMHNLKVVTNPKVFRLTETPEADRLPPEG